MLPATVRMKLALTAAAGLVLMGLMTTLVLNTSSAAFDVVARTQADHQRMRSFVQLRFALDRLQGRAYEVVRSGEAEVAAARENLAQARAEFVRALERAQNMQLKIVTVSGKGADNPSRRLGDVNVYMPSARYGWIESGHHVILHYWLDRYLNLHGQGAL